MKTLQQLADTLRTHIARLNFTQQELADAAGVSRQTLSKVLSGRADLRLTTLFALADRLGLEVLLVPQEIAQGLDTDAVAKPRVQNIVEAALSALPKSTADEQSATSRNPRQP